MNIESDFIKYYSQDDEILSEQIEIYEVLTEEQIFLIQKRFAMDIATIFRQLKYENKADLIKNCNSLRYMQQCIKDPNHKHFRGSFCKDRYCPICSHIKSHKETQMLFSIMESMQKDNNYKNCYLIFVTLTQKNVTTGELKDEVNKINGAVKELLKNDKLFKSSKRKDKGKMVNVKPLCIGTIRHLEVTAGYKPSRRRIEYHPHVHLLLLVRKDYWNKESNQWTHKKLMKKWRELMNLDYDPVVHITLVKNDGMDKIIEIRESQESTDISTTDIESKTAKKNNLVNLDTDGALKEISKYETKDTDKIKFIKDKETGRVEINWNDSREIIRELYISLHQKRTTVMTGEFLKQKKRLFGNKDADDLIDEMQDAELVDLFKNIKCKKCGSPVTEHLLRYSGSKKIYLELGKDKLETYKQGMNAQVQSIIDRRREAKNKILDNEKNVNEKRDIIMKMIDEDAKIYPFEDVQAYLECIYKSEEVEEYMQKKTDESWQSYHQI